MRNGHLWSQSYPVNPKSCHECNLLLLSGQDSNGRETQFYFVEICECDYCGSFIHEDCIRKSKFHCKQLTSTKKQIPHLWLVSVMCLMIVGLMGTLILELRVASVKRKLRVL